MLIIPKIGKMSFSQWSRITIVTVIALFSFYSTLLDAVLIASISFVALLFRVRNRPTEDPNKHMLFAGAVIFVLSIGASCLNVTEAEAKKHRDTLGGILAEALITYEPEKKWVVLKYQSVCDGVVSGVSASFVHGQSQLPMKKWKQEEDPAGSSVWWSWWYITIDELRANGGTIETAVRAKFLDRDGQVLGRREDDVTALAGLVYDEVQGGIPPSTVTVQPDSQLFTRIARWCDNKDSRDTERIDAIWRILQRQTPTFVIVLDHDDSGAHRCEIHRVGIPAPSNESGKRRTGK